MRGASRVLVIYFHLPRITPAHAGSIETDEGVKRVM